MGFLEVLPLIIQGLWIAIAIPLVVILIIYGMRVADYGFPVMVSPAPAAYVFVILSLLIIVIFVSLLLRFDCVCCSTRAVGLCVVLASLVIENLAIAYYGADGGDMAKWHAVGSIGNYTRDHPSPDPYTDWWGKWVFTHLGDKDAIPNYIEDRTVTPARLVFGFTLTWFVLHTVVFYLIILPRDGLPETPLAAGTATKGYSI
jgi:hypothetical protein